MNLNQTFGAEPNVSPSGAVIRKNLGTWHERNCVSLHSARNFHLRWLNIRAYNFSVSGL